MCDASSRSCSVARFSWTSTAGLRNEGVVAAAGLREHPRIVAVVPPAPGKLVSYLIVGTNGGSELLVLALPGLALVHTHNLGVLFRMLGLAADPWGEAIAVIDYQRFTPEVYVLSWPLEGMPELE